MTGDHPGRYRQFVKNRLGGDEGTAMAAAVGGQFEAMGLLERALLVSVGLPPGGKASGRIVFSFIEFSIADHWKVFEGNLAAIGVDGVPLNQFMSGDGIGAWAAHLGLHVEAIYDRDVPSIPLPEPVTLEGGRRFETLGKLR